MGSHGTLVPILLALGGIACAPGRPDFSGDWEFDPRRSSLEIPPPDATTFHIEHREPRFHLSRTHRIGEASDTFSIDLTTDGAEVVRHRGELEIRARAYWDGEVLVFDSVLERASERGSNVVRYHLEDGGRTFVAEERYRSEPLSYDNRWVFGRR